MQKGESLKSGIVLLTLTIPILKLQPKTSEKSLGVGTKSTDPEFS